MLYFDFGQGVVKRYVSFPAKGIWDALPSMVLAAYSIIRAEEGVPPEWLKRNAMLMFTYDPLTDAEVDAFLLQVLKTVPAD